MHLPANDPLPLILVASADKPAASSLVSMLDAWRYPVHMVEDGPSALKILTGNPPPAMALLDLDLPVLGGLEVIAEMRRRNEKKATWLMVLGAEADGERVRSASEAGADDFLLKPIDEFDLRVRLRVAERVQALMNRLQQQAEAAQFYATHDALTGLLNREELLKLLFQETDRVQRMKTPLSLMVLDLDGFSRINLDHGYDAGDLILKELASRLKRHLRSYDLIGRYGEDEFLLALPGCTAENVFAMATRMKKCVLQVPFDLEYERVTVTASMGVSQSRGRSPLVVLRESERALADAKLNGRDCVRNFNAEEIAASGQMDSLQFLRLSETSDKVH